MSRLSDASPVMLVAKVVTIGSYIAVSRWAFRAVATAFPDATPKDFIMWGTFIVHSIVFWGLSMATNVLNLTKWPKWLYATKIQADVEVTFQQHVKCFFVVLANQLLILLPLMYLSVNWLTNAGMSIDPDEMPGVLTLVKHLVVFVMAEEFMFYYCHYLLHQVAYKYVHKMHHNFPAPIAMAAEYAHPIEFLFGNCIPILLGPLLTGAHCQVLWFWIMIAISATCNGHSGYRIPFSPFHDARNHDFHHSNYKGNYGSTGLLDWLHGTDQAYNRHLAKQKQKGA